MEVMMAGPPDEPRGPMSDVMDEVSRALSDADVHDPATKAALMDGVREALEALGARPRADVTVLPGGRDDAPGRGRGRGREAGGPDLRLTPGSGGAETPSDRTLADVRVVRRAPRPRLGGPGLLLLAADERQVVFRGAAAHAYRVACVRGDLGLSVDGEPCGQLRAGQTADVEAGLIQVIGGPDGAEGHYIRL